jgi:membrane-associated phospholipid phosphatase
MKSQISNFFNKLGSPADQVIPVALGSLDTKEKILKRDLLLGIIPGVFWAIATSARSSVIHPSCPSDLAHCQKSFVFFLDQLSIAFQIEGADDFSLFAQNFSIGWVILVPMTWSLIRSLRAKRFILPWPEMASDFLIALQVIFWNGFLTEMSHWMSARPRPFVYENPQVLGTEPSHYTSFYSGHTSFVAASQIITLLILISRRAPLALVLIDLAAAEVLIFSTGYFRILAGRHFLTDVLAGAVAGTFCALILFGCHSKKSFSRT